MKTGQPPWVLWGNSQSYTGLTVPPSDGAELVPQRQLCRVAYGRPESWRFWFAAQIQATTPINAGDVSGRLLFDFDISIGIGRSTLQILGFETYDIPLSPIPSTLVWSTVVRGPRRVATDATSTSLTEVFVAQDIQLLSQVRSAGVGTGFTGVNVVVHAYLSPNVHIRPEWHLPEFPGEENNGK